MSSGNPLLSKYDIGKIKYLFLVMYKYYFVICNVRIEFMDSAHPEYCNLFHNSIFIIVS
jgi:hypothetical protein